MLYFLPAKATISRKRIRLKEEQDCDKKMKETLRHNQADIRVDDKQKLNRTLQTLMKIIYASIDFVAAFQKEVLTFQDQNTSIIVPFNHEKGDTSVFLHVWHVCNIILTSGAPYALIEIVDTDVLIIALALLPHLELEKMWMGFGNGLNRINIPIYDIYQQLEHYRSAGLLFSYFPMVNRR